MDLHRLRLPEWLPLDWLPLEGEAKAQAAMVLLALALAAACLVLGRVLSSVAAGTARWLRVAVGTRSVPAAPGALPLLGHALSLATAYCPWERMLEWARQKGPLTRFSILYRTGLIVNDPAGAKRVFQVRPWGAPRRSRRAPRAGRPAAGLAATLAVGAALLARPRALAAGRRHACCRPRLKHPNALDVPPHLRFPACFFLPARRVSGCTTRTWTSPTSPSCPSWAPAWSPQTARTGRSSACSCEGQLPAPRRHACATLQGAGRARQSRCRLVPLVAARTLAGRAPRQPAVPALPTRPLP